MFGPGSHRDGRQDRGTHSELRDRYTIVIVTHNMQQASRVSDKTAFFYVGELVEFGETLRGV